MPDVDGMGQTEGVRIHMSDWNPGPKLEKPP